MLAGAGASAEDEAAAFGGKGHGAISAERTFGFVRADMTTSAGGTDRTTHANAFSLLGNGLGLLTLYVQPRLAFDFFATQGFSLGAAATYFRVSESTDVPAGQPAASSPVLSGYVLAPRVGYAFAISRIVSLWPRLGFTFAHFETETTTTIINGMTTTSSSGTSVYALTIEARSSSPWRSTSS
jgi:hypothetical protein